MTGNPNIGIGNKAATRRPDRPAVENLPGTNAVSGTLIAEANVLKKERPRICAAMAEQNGEFGRDNESAPQELLHLVGYRDPNARLVPRVRPNRFR